MGQTDRQIVEPLLRRPCRAVSVMYRSGFHPSVCLSVPLVNY